MKKKTHLKVSNDQIYQLQIFDCWKMVFTTFLPISIKKFAHWLICLMLLSKKDINAGARTHVRQVFSCQNLASHCSLTTVRLLFPLVWICSTFSARNVCNSGQENLRRRRQFWEQSMCQFKCWKFIKLPLKGIGAYSYLQAQTK